MTIDRGELARRPRRRYFKHHRERAARPTCDRRLYFFLSPGSAPKNAFQTKSNLSGTAISPASRDGLPRCKANTALRQYRQARQRGRCPVAIGQILDQRVTNRLEVLRPGRRIEIAGNAALIAVD